MSEKVAADFAKNGVADGDVGQRIDWNVSAFLARFDARRHGMAAFAETDGFARFQARDVSVAARQDRFFWFFLHF